MSTADTNAFAALAAALAKEIGIPEAGPSSDAVFRLEVAGIPVSCNNTTLDNGIVCLGGLVAPLRHLGEAGSTPEEKVMALLSVFVQQDMTPRNLAPGQPWGDFLAEIPGWNAMTAGHEATP
jgi:hypothetical protein